MDNLRLELEKITKNGDPKSHPYLIDKLKSKFHHSIRVEESLVDISKYTCILYAFDIVDNQEYISLARRCPKAIFANTEFLKFLIDKNYLLPSNKESDKKLIIYSDKNNIKHIGRLIEEGSVLSKWGTGHLYKHPIFEIPSNYGNDVKYFLAINKENVLRFFIEFAKTKGVKFN